MSRRRAGSGGGSFFERPSRPKLKCKRFFDLPGGLPFLSVDDLAWDGGDGFTALSLIIGATDVSRELAALVDA